LKRYGPLAVTELRAWLADHYTLYRMWQAQPVLEWLTSEKPTREELRLIRATTVLEIIGTPQALQTLQALAGGDADALLTQEAKAALGRLSP
jgi:hypothetical protein